MGKEQNNINLENQTVINQKPKKKTNLGLHIYIMSLQDQQERKANRSFNSESQMGISENQTYQSEFRLVLFSTVGCAVCKDLYRLNKM